jgi:hypothetical protein
MRQSKKPMKEKTENASFKGDMGEGCYTLQAGRAKEKGVGGMGDMKGWERYKNEERTRSIAATLSTENRHSFVVVVAAAL